MVGAIINGDLNGGLSPISRPPVPSSRGMVSQHTLIKWLSPETPTSGS
uniref:Uncharacterized protein n=1 Tax=Moniliophthora roreri TaxID=221103 RepID=A0A0W0FHL7_MONRR